MKMKFIFLAGLSLANAIHTKLNPLTHNIEYFMDFHDNLSPYKTDPIYLVAKQCAETTLQLHTSTQTTAVTNFQDCLSIYHPSLVNPEYFEPLSYVFQNIFSNYNTANQKYWESESARYVLYNSYEDAKHTLGLIRPQIDHFAKHYTESLHIMTLETSYSDAVLSLEDVAEQINTIKSSVDSSVAVFKQKIQTEGADYETKIADYLAAKHLVVDATTDYEKNVTAVLNLFASRPTSAYNCPTGYYCSDANTQTPCPAGTFQPSERMTDNYSCIQCGVGEYSAAGATECLICAGGTQMDASECSVVAPLASLTAAIPEFTGTTSISQKFYITYDLTRAYSTASDTLLSADATALAAGKSTIRTAAGSGGPARYKPSSAVTIGAVVDAKTFKWATAVGSGICAGSGKCFQINLERNSVVTADSAANPATGSIEYWNGDRGITPGFINGSGGDASGHMEDGNWVDGNLYDFHIDKDAASLPVYTLGATPPSVNENGVQWTITAWGQTVLRGTIDDTSIPGKTRFVVKLGSNGLPEYRPFSPTLDVNPQEQFNQANTELVAYVFDGAIANLVADTSVLTPELLTTTPAQRYVSETLVSLSATYGAAAYQTALNNTDLTSADVVAQTDLTKYKAPYIDGHTDYTLETAAATWDLKYSSGHSILTGTRAGKVLTGVPVKEGAMIEFPVSLAGAAGYAVVDNVGQGISSLSLK